MIFDLVVERQDVEHVQQLPLVLMQPLDLHVEDRVGIDVDAVVLGDVGRQTDLVLALDGPQIFQHVQIAAVLLECLERIGVFQEAVADERLQIAGEGRVRLAQPAAVGNAVGDVEKAAVVEIIIIAENGLFQNVRMQLRNAVDLMAAGQAEVRHADLVVGDDGHIVPLAGVVRVDALQLFHETAVDLLADRVDPRQLLLEQADRPALERFGHDSMVGVGERGAGDLPRAVPAVVVLIDEQAHQLRHAQGRMGIVDVDGDLVSKVVERVIVLQVLVQDRLQRA